MGAYAALLSLSHTLDQIFILDQYPLLLEKEKLVSLQENVTSLMTFLEDYSSKYRGVLNPLERRIIDAAYQAEDMIETQLLRPQRPFAFKGRMRCFLSSNSNQEMMEQEEFYQALQEINSISEEAASKKAENTPPRNFSCVSSTTINAPTDMNTMKYTMVGLDDDFMAIKDQMYRESSTFHVIPVYGMGGIGKTTLATRLYEDSIKMQWFDRRIWIVVSQDYSPRKILLEILRSMKMSIDEKRTDSELAQTVYQELFGRRYLIVADDVWNEEAWDILNRVLPKNTIGSQVLVTTRLQSVAAYVGSSTSSQREIHFLSEEQSWRLLEDRVFGKESCPLQLEQIGMDIAKCCHGLPLTIVVVAGLLKEDITEAYWRRTLHMISSSARSDMVEHCSKVLSLSYDYLPVHLKPCFLIVTAFQEDYEVEADLLVRLWMAEGFVKETGLECVEEVAERYLNDLVGRSLIIATRKSYNKKIKAVKVHDSLRDVGKLKAQEGRFYGHGDSWRPEDKERVVITDNFKIRDFSKCEETPFRTYLNTRKYADFSYPFQNSRMLRVLYSPDVSVNLSLMVLLRYVSIYRYKSSVLFSKLRYLQTLDISRSFYSKRERGIPLKIWKMPFLRHVKISRECHLKQPSVSDIIKETNLQTLSEARNLKMTPKVVKMLANIRKLDLYYKDVGFWCRQKLKLNNLVHLQKLEELRISNTFSGLDWRKGIRSSELNLPISLKKLELTRVMIPWEYISRVGLLPNLEYFGIDYGGRGREWNPTEGGFLKLRHLELKRVSLKHWGAERNHFPRLETLVLMGSDQYSWPFQLQLQEIPSGIGEIDGLKLIELYDCQPSLVASAKEIQTEQQEMGNEELQVHVHESERFASAEHSHVEY